MVPAALVIPYFWEGKWCSCPFTLPSASKFPCLTFCLSAPLPWTWLFQWCGGLNQINRDQNHPEEVNPVVACVLRTQESEPVKMNLRKAPDLQKDDLAQRRIQGRHTPHREAPSFIKLSSITEADLETWERLKVSEKTRCVMVLPPIMVGITIQRIERLSRFLFLFWCASHNTEHLEVSTFCVRGNVNTKSHVSRKRALYPADFLRVVIYSPKLAYCKEFQLDFWITSHCTVPTVFLCYQFWCWNQCFESTRILKLYLPRQEQWSVLHLSGWWECHCFPAMVIGFMYLVLSSQPHLHLSLPWNPLEPISGSDQGWRCSECLYPWALTGNQRRDCYPRWLCQP